MNFLYVFFTLIALFAVVFAAVRLLNQRSTKFTAVQSAMQGRAYKLGFYAIIIYTLLYAFLEFIGIVWCDAVTGLLLGVLIGVGTFILGAIHYDAYDDLKIDNRFWYYFSIAAAVLCLASTIISFIKGTFFTDGKLCFGSCSLFAGLVWAALLFVQHAHFGYEEVDEDEEDEE